MEQILEKSFEHAPALVAIVAVVWIFSKVALRVSEQYNAIMQEMNRDNLEARMESRRVIEANTHAASANTAALHEMTEVVRQLNQKREPQ